MDGCIAFQYRQPVVPLAELFRVPCDRCHRVASRQGLLHGGCAGPAIGTEDRQPQRPDGLVVLGSPRVAHRFDLSTSGAERFSTSQLTQRASSA